MSTEQHRDVRNFVTVFGSAIFCAGLLTAFLLYYYNPSGQYLASHTLLDPAIIEQIDYQDEHPFTRKMVHFYFDHIEFSYDHPKKGYQRLTLIPIKDYEKFYALVSSEKSLMQSKDPVIQDLFAGSKSSLLTITMRIKENNENLPAKVFQVVQFVPEDYFRVQLHENAEGEWAYFYQLGIFQKVMQLFTSSNE